MPRVLGTGRVRLRWPVGLQGSGVLSSVFESTTTLGTADTALGADVHLWVLLTLRLHRVCPASRRLDRLRGERFLPER